MRLRIRRSEVRRACIRRLFEKKQAVEQIEVKLEVLKDMKGATLVFRCFFPSSVRISRCLKSERS